MILLTSNYHAPIFSSFVAKFTQHNTTLCEQCLETLSGHQDILEHQQQKSSRQTNSKEDNK